MNSLIDTNVLVYCFDPRDARKQSRAIDLIRRELKAGTVRLAHQSLVEFFAATTRPLEDLGGSAMLSQQEAAWEAEELLRQFKVLYPSEAQVRLALRGCLTYGLGWFAACLWSFAEINGVDVLYSEDFQHDRVYGTVRVVNPFV